MVPHHGTNWAALRLTAQIGRDAVLSESYGRGYWYSLPQAKAPPHRPRNRPNDDGRTPPTKAAAPRMRACPKERSDHEKEEEFEPR